MEVILTEKSNKTNSQVARVDKAQKTQPAINSYQRALLKWRSDNEVANAAYIHENATRPRVRQIRDAALARFDSIGASDAIEEMLAAQMVATHEATMALMERAARAISPKFSAECAKTAAKLASIYTRQMEALDKHRGKGQQNVRVEHVYVERGGQAVIGDVSVTPNSSTDQPPDKPELIPHAPAMAFDIDVEMPPAVIVKAPAK